MAKKTFIQRIRFKYKLSILNENTLEEVWRMRLSKMTVFISCFFVAVIYFFLIAALIIKTPLRGFLPGYTENISLRKQLTLDAVQIDSISEKLSLQTQYLETIKMIMSSDIPVDSTVSIDSLKTMTMNDLMLEPSKKEIAFRDSFESQEKVNISIMNNEPGTIEKNYLMKRPVKGQVIDSFDIRRDVYGVTVLSETDASISSVLDGVVISVAYSFDNLYVMYIQHSDNFVSVYKVQQPFIKKVGDKVHAGEIITTLRDGAGLNVKFELWKEGMALDPRLFITF